MGKTGRDSGNPNGADQRGARPQIALIVLTTIPWGNFISANGAYFCAGLAFRHPFRIVLLTSEELRKWLVRRTLVDVLP
jgi:hypothetical protein